MLEKYKLRQRIATKIGFGKGVVEEADVNNNIIAIGADITKSVSLNFFAEKYPERFVSLGIAEQNCVGVAAGLALSGKIPVFATYGVFASMRPADQIRISLCYNKLHVVIGGAHAGISVGADGATHQALEDIAVMRVLPNMVVLSPCDATQTQIAVKHAIRNLNQPVYIRFGREPVPDFTEINQDFEIGKAQILIDGSDIAIISTGHMTWYALEAAKHLQENNISAMVVNVHTIKPIDRRTLIQVARKTNVILTVEEHQVIGGLGSAVAEVLSTEFPVPMRIIGVNDSFGESGTPDELMLNYGLSTQNIVDKAMDLIDLKNNCI